MIDFSIRKYVGLCEKCESPIEYSFALFRMINDPIVSIVKCEKCKSHIKIENENFNKETMSIVCGGTLIKVIDVNDSTSLNKVSDLMSLKDIQILETNSHGFYKNDIFTPILSEELTNPFLVKNKASLYSCKCGNNLEAKIYDELENNYRDKLNEYFQNMSIAYSKNWLGNFERIVIEFDILCSCKCEYRVFLYTHPFLYGHKPKIGQILIAGVNGKSLKQINGIYSKNDCKAFVEKYALRWNLLSAKSYVATAFIGDQYKKTEALETLWSDLCYYFPSKKSQLITKTRTKNSYEAKVDENGHYSELKKYGQVDDLQLRTHTFEKSHAKFYAGIIDYRTEILVGSFNFTTGPSKENISFIKMDTNEFNNEYLNEYNLEYEEIENSNRYLYKSFSKREFDEMTTIDRNTLLKRVFTD